MCYLVKIQESERDQERESKSVAVFFLANGGFAEEAVSFSAIFSVPSATPEPASGNDGKLIVRCISPSRVQDEVFAPGGARVISSICLDVTFVLFGVQRRYIPLPLVVSCDYERYR